MTHAATNLWIYPIKSCRGIAVEQFTLADRAELFLAYDEDAVERFIRLIRE